MKLHRRHLLQVGAAALACAVFASRVRAQATQPAANPVANPVAQPFDTLNFDWTDASRQRPVPSRLYLPASGAGSKPTPLMVFSHGLGGSRTGYSWLGRYAAAQGIASLHLQHVGSDRQLWTGGNVLNLVGRLQAAAQESEAINRVQDLRFGLDQLLRGDLADRFDAQRIVAAGHSYGANTALLASGARVQRQGKAVDLQDPRIRAAVAMSAPPFYGDSDARSILSSVAVPSLHVTCTEDVIRIPGYYSSAADRVTVFDATGGPRKWLAVYEGGSHSIFTDRGGTGGLTLNPQIKAATQELVLAFVRSVFDGEESSITAWPQRHAALLARFSEGRA